MLRRDVLKGLFGAFGVGTAVGSSIESSRVEAMTVAGPTPSWHLSGELRVLNDGMFATFQQLWRRGDESEWRDVPFVDIESPATPTTTSFVDPPRLEHNGPEA